MIHNQETKPSKNIFFIIKTIISVEIFNIMTSYLCTIFWNPHIQAKKSAKKYVFIVFEVVECPECFGFGSLTIWKKTNI